MNKRTVLYLILVIALFLTAFVWFRYLSEVRPAGGEEAVSGEFVTRLGELRRLKEIRLDASFLDDPFFNSLTVPTPTASPLEPQGSPGRTNPFSE